MGFLQIPGVSVHKELAGHFWFWANEVGSSAPWQQLCLITFISSPKEYTSLKFCHRASPQGASGSSAEYVLLITHPRNLEYPGTCGSSGTKWPRHCHKPSCCHQCGCTHWRANQLPPFPPCCVQHNTQESQKPPSKQQQLKKQTLFEGNAVKSIQKAL